MLASTVVGTSTVHAALSPQEQAAVEVAERVLDATAQSTEELEGIFLVRSDGRRATLVESTVGEQRELQCSWHRHGPARGGAVNTGALDYV